MGNKCVVLMLMFMSIVSAVLSGCGESKTEENQASDTDCMGFIHFRLCNR